MPGDPLTKEGSRPGTRAESRMSVIHEKKNNRLDKRIVRVFFSSPFRGLEIEREEMTKKYWPRLSTMCSKAGFEFVPVDLRWGITSEMTENAGTLNVCLREVDRSDMIVGFFGQRYGWHGSDELLQKSFDAASVQYPWVDEYRDRSVTEIEFLHGHLRNPGNKPACFFFRDKAYDDKMLEDCLSSNSQIVSMKYQSSTDGKDSAERLDDLKTRILESREQCLDVVDNYSNPMEGAQRMFEAIESYLLNTVLVTPAEDISDHEKASQQHNAYYISRLGIGANREYIGGDKYLKEVDRHVRPDVERYENKPLLVLGDPGFGKTTLLANWLFKHQQEHPEDIVAGHFVGCAPNSTKERDVMIRLIMELKMGFNNKSIGTIETDTIDKSESDNESVNALKERDCDDVEIKAEKDHTEHGNIETGYVTTANSGDSADAMNNKEENTTDVKNKQLIHDANSDDNKNFKTEFTIDEDINDLHSKLVKMTTYEMFQELQDMLEKISKSGLRAVIIIDALNKMDPVHRTKKELYWLPTKLPDGVSLLVSSLSDTKGTQILLEERNYDKLDVQPLTVAAREKVIKEMLDLRGKELRQLHVSQITEKVQTENPLFLKIFLQDLCNFGDFEKLEDHIESLLKADSTKELFIKVLEGLEMALDPSKSCKDSVISRVMSSIMVSRSGLSEQEIKSITNIPDHIWSMIYFTVDDFFIDRAGLQGFAYDELTTAVQERYCNEKEVRIQHITAVADYFESCLQKMGNVFRKSAKVPSRIAKELPWLLNKAGNTERLKTCLTHLGLFTELYRTNDGTFDLYEYWTSLETHGKEISSLYMKSVNEQVVYIYTDWLEQYGEARSPAKELLEVVYCIAEILNDSGHPKHSIQFTERSLKLQKFAYTEEDLVADSSAASMYCETLNKLACTYCDLEYFEDSEKLHLECLAMRENYNGLAGVYKGQRNYDKAMEYYKKCLEGHKAEKSENHWLVGCSLNNIGTALIAMKNYGEAVDYFQETLKVYEVCYFGRFHPEIAGTLNNLAICYRNLKELDKAEPLYKRSYDMSVQAYGEKHPDVAGRLMNWGVFQQQKKNYPTALDMYKRALAIYKDVFHDEHVRVLFVMENIAIVLVLMERQYEAHSYFLEAGEILYRQGRINTSLPSLNRRMLAYYVDNKRFDDATNLLLRMLDASFAEPIHYCALDEIDRMKGTERPKRKYEHTLEYARTRYPDSEDIKDYLKELEEEAEESSNTVNKNVTSQPEVTEAKID
ncbi:TPR repeat-containing protein DDB_G0287407-like [Saccoglossus kowalevskii]